MPRGKKHSAEQVVNLLRQIEVGVANGILYPVRTHCSSEEAASFTAAFDQGETIVPRSITETLVSDFKLTA